MTRVLYFLAIHFLAAPVALQRVEQNLLERGCYGSTRECQKSTLGQLLTCEQRLVVWLYRLERDIETVT